MWVNDDEEEGEEEEEEDEEQRGQGAFLRVSVGRPVPRKKATATCEAEISPHLSAIHTP